MSFCSCHLNRSLPTPAATSVRSRPSLNLAHTTTALAPHPRHKYRLSALPTRDCFARRFISSSSEGFRWFEVSSSGGQGAQRGDIAWPRVAGAVCAGDWNGCAAARVAAAARGQLTVARRLFGVEMRLPDVEKDVTVLWCKSAAERDVGGGAARRVSSLADTAVAGHGCRPQHHASAPIKASAFAAAAAAALIHHQAHLGCIRRHASRPMACS
jgi:hypothetical protein